ncbi:MAG: hypothetical protein ACI8X5_003930 [Planctomycetota bacterium]|jgi:hypothetical protein
MWLVPGNEDLPYTFGGSEHELENARLRRIGLVELWVGSGQSQPGKTQEPWKVGIPAGFLEPYYLDEDQVSCEEYARFLQDPVNGYANISHWLLGDTPSEGRKQQLIEEFKSSANSPATGVTFAEAHAYATSVGKRLPTLLELEFAERGGNQYRMHSWDWRGLQTGNPTAPWSRVQDLSNGSEWSATPAWRAGDPGVNSREVPKDAKLFAQPSLEQLALSTELWVRGDPASQRLDFAVRLPLARNARRTDLGFRCALDAAKAAHWLLQVHQPESR